MAAAIFQFGLNFAKSNNHSKIAYKDLGGGGGDVFVCNMISLL